MPKMIDQRQIGVSIKTLRIKKNLTQEVLSEKVGYSVRQLRRYENEGTVNISVVNAFARTFNVSALDILEGVSF